MRENSPIHQDLTQKQDILIIHENIYNTIQCIKYCASKLSFHCCMVLLYHDKDKVKTNIKHQLNFVHLLAKHCQVKIIYIQCDHNISENI